MGIIHARVDERLIHGQVAMVWTNSLGATRIMVVNDLAPKDEMQIGALKMAKPTGVKLSILSVEKAVINILAGKYDDQKVFLITKDVKDMARLIEGGVKLEGFNVGNVSQKDGFIRIKKSVSLSQDDIDEIKKLSASGIKITAQMLPSESGDSIIGMLPK